MHTSAALSGRALAAKGPTCGPNDDPYARPMRMGYGPSRQTSRATSRAKAEPGRWTSTTAPSARNRGQPNARYVLEQRIPPAFCQKPHAVTTQCANAGLWAQTYQPRVHRDTGKGTKGPNDARWHCLAVATLRVQRQHVRGRGPSPEVAGGWAHKPRSRHEDHSDR